MIRPNCRAIFRLVFEQVEWTIDDAPSIHITHKPLLVCEIISIYSPNNTIHSNALEFCAFNWVVATALRNIKHSGG